MPRERWLQWIDDQPHALLGGRTRAGKTTLATAILAQRLRGGEQVFIIDPHASGWLGLPTAGSAANPGELARALGVVLAEYIGRMQARDKHKRETGQELPHDHFGRLNVLVDEANSIADELRAEWKTVVKQLASGSRKVGISLLVMAQSPLVEDLGTQLLITPSPRAPGDPAPGRRPEQVAYVRAEQEKRLRRAERGLVALGKVNPLALEEFAALEERHRFLVEQLDDLRRSKADLLGIVADIDARVQQVFGEAFADTAREFEGVFARLFPGGEGRLVLTDPDDMLTTGLEVEARPAGKKVKRLSLLSGGERSLTAVALLVAIFKARPSPFYIMDEVEAALDDVNLGRLIDIFAELRDSSQLIVITHQKRTMEGADALYGVTMRGDGVSTVISQRIDRE